MTAPAAANTYTLAVEKLVKKHRVIATAADAAAAAAAKEQKQRARRRRERGAAGGLLLASRPTHCIRPFCQSTLPLLVE